MNRMHGKKECAEKGDLIVLEEPLKELINQKNIQEMEKDADEVIPERPLPPERIFQSIEDHHKGAVVSSLFKSCLFEGFGEEMTFEKKRDISPVFDELVLNDKDIVIPDKGIWEDIGVKKKDNYPEDQTMETMHFSIIHG